MTQETKSFEKCRRYFAPNDRRNFNFWSIFQSLQVSILVDNDDDELMFENLFDVMMDDKFHELINVGSDFFLILTTEKLSSVSILLCFFVGSTDSVSLRYFFFLYSFFFLCFQFQ